MAVKPLYDHYSFTTPASVFDEEAITALELAGRTAAKVNETVRAFNEHEAKIDDRVTAQDNAIDYRLNRQDQMINNAIDETIPATVKADVNQHIQNGDFDKQINEYAGDLESRLENLLGSATEGSTALDAEIIDARQDSQNVTHKNLGAALRSVDQINNIRAKDALGFTYEMVDKTYKNGYYTVAGTFVTNENVQTLEVNVTPGEVYIYDVINGYDVVAAVVFDGNGNVAQWYGASSDGNHRINKTDAIVIPPGGAKLCVQSFPIVTDGTNKYYGNVWKVTGGQLNTKDIADYIDKRFSLLGLTPVLGDDVPYTMAMENRYISATTERATKIDGDKYFVTVFNVKPGDLIYIEGSASYKNYVYSFSGKGAPLGVNLRNAESDSQLVFAGEVRVPENATMLEVASEISSTVRPVAKYVTGYEMPGGSSDSGATAKEFEGLTWVVMGDSLTEKNSRATKNYHDYIAEKTGINVLNLGVSGAGYLNGFNEGNAFIHQVGRIPSDATCVTIFGSGNDVTLSLGDPSDIDSGNPYTVYGAIGNVINEIQMSYPLLPIGIVSPTPWESYNPSINGNAMQLYTEALQTVCEKKGIPFLDLYHCSGLKPWDESFRFACYTRDDGNGQHPDENGHKLIAPRFYAFLQSLIGGTY